MRDLIKIGEMAKLFGLTVKTLRYYDQIGLLKAAYINPETGYRYYSVEQFEQLNTILYLRTQGMPLADIAEALTHLSPGRIKSLLSQQLESVNTQMQRLQQVQTNLKSRIEQIEDLMENDMLDTLRFMDFPVRPVAQFNHRMRIGSNTQRSLHYPDRIGSGPNYFLGKVGVSLPLQDLQRGEADGYEQMFYLLDAEEHPEGSPMELPAGRWAIWRYRGGFGEVNAQYQRMADELYARGLNPVGDAVAFTLIDSGLTERPDEYTAELQIPIRFCLDPQLP